MPLCEKKYEGPRRLANKSIVPKTPLKASGILVYTAHISKFKGARNWQKTLRRGLPGGESNIFPSTAIVGRGSVDFATV